MTYRLKTHSSSDKSSSKDCSFNIKINYFYFEFCLQSK